MAELTPSGGTEIINTTEGVAASQLITVSDLEDVTWTYSVTGIGDAQDDPAAIVFTENGPELTVEYTGDDVIALQYLRYLDTDRNVVQIDGAGAFDQLPPPSESPEMVAMREDDQNVQRWTVDVTAEGTVPDTEPEETDSVSASYEVAVFADYDISRDKLVDAVEQRK